MGANFLTMKILFPIIAFFLLLTIQLNAQHKREFRGVWIATVNNIDWPKSGTTATQQKQDLIAILDKMVDLKLNAAVFQVRTECDALYNSAYEPWSRYLVSPQGTYPGYDPLQFAIEEAHKRGIELHAWLNPYRINASTSDGGNYYHPTHIYVEHPEWAITYSDKRKILNPGLPQVAKYIKQVVGDILGKYDVDGIHFDDYFYNSGTTDAMDQEAYDLYGQAYPDRGDFRRASVNYMVSQVFDTIQQIKPYVRFGISPAGIYRPGIPPGIEGRDNYNVLYCDPLAWLNQGTVDYVNPQLYWPTSGKQDYGTLLPWWSQQAFNKNRHLYSGNATYNLPVNPTAKISKLLRFREIVSRIFNRNKEITNTADPWNLGQIKTQIQINRNHRHYNAFGSVFFSNKDFTRVTGLADYTKNEIFITKAIVPEMGWKTAPSLAVPSNLRMEYDPVELCNYLKWDYPTNNTRFIVYMDDLSIGNVDIANPDNIYILVYENRLKLTESFPIPQGIVVTALDRNGFESGPSTVYGIDPPDKPVLVSPTNLATVALNFSFQWENLTTASSYTLQVSTNSNFSNLVVNTSGISGNSHSALSYGLSGEQTYYWRVAGVNPGGQGEFSNPFSFTTGYPSTPVITSPVHLANGVALKPTITWTGATMIDSILFQISEGGTAFDPAKIVVSEMAKGVSGSYTITKTLKEYTTHYVRAKAYNSYGESVYSGVVQFKTLMLPPSTKPEISSPANNATNVALPVTVNWTTAQGASTYMVQLAENTEFTVGLMQVEIFSGTTHTYSSLASGKKYYLRVAGKNLGGLGEWSTVVNFTTAGTTSVEDISTAKNRLFCYPNPVENSILTIDFKVVKSGLVKVKMMNSKGQLIKEIYCQQAPVGSYKITADLSGLVPDVYMIILENETEEIFKIIKK